MPLGTETDLKNYLSSFNQLRSLELSIFTCRTWGFTFDLFHTIVSSIPTLSDLVFAISADEPLTKDEVHRVEELALTPATASLRYLKLALRFDGRQTFSQKPYWNCFATLWGQNMSHISHLHLGWQNHMYPSFDNMVDFDEEITEEYAEDSDSEAEDLEGGEGDESEADDVEAPKLPGFTELRWLMPKLKSLSLRWWDEYRPIKLGIISPVTLESITVLYIECPRDGDFDEFNDVSILFICWN